MFHCFWHHWFVCPFFLSSFMLLTANRSQLFSFSWSCRLLWLSSLVYKCHVSWLFSSLHCSFSQAHTAMVKNKQTKTKKKLYSINYCFIHRVGADSCFSGITVGLNTNNLVPHNWFIMFLINTVDKASNCVKDIFQQEKKLFYVIVFVIVILNSMNCWNDLLVQVVANALKPQNWFSMQYSLFVLHASHSIINY